MLLNKRQGYQTMKLRKKQVDQRKRSGKYQTPTNPYNQGSSIKGLGIQHHQDQYAPRFGVSHIQDLQTKSPIILKCQTRIFPTYYEGLQDHT